MEFSQSTLEVVVSDSVGMLNPESSGDTLSKLDNISGILVSLDVHLLDLSVVKLDWESSWREVSGRENSVSEFDFTESEESSLNRVSSIEIGVDLSVSVEHSQGLQVNSLNVLNGISNQAWDIDDDLGLVLSDLLASHDSGDNIKG